MSAPRKHVIAPGTRVGKLTVLGEAAIPKRHYIVQCDCGTVRTVSCGHLIAGDTRACNRNNCRADTARHGHARKGRHTSEYNTWYEMIRRCTYSKHKRWRDYGGRGIQVCGRWQKSFPSFLSDMGAKPSPVHTIERIDVNGNYEPDNCKWATKQEQSGNQRRSIRVTINSETKCLAEWIRHFGLNQHTVRSRINYGWPVVEALGL